MYLAIRGDAVLAAELLADAVDLQRVALTALVAVAPAVRAAVHVQLVGGAEACETLVTAQLVHRSHVVHLMFSLQQREAEQVMSKTVCNFQELFPPRNAHPWLHERETQWGQPVCIPNRRNHFEELLGEHWRKCGGELYFWSGLFGHWFKCDV